MSHEALCELAEEAIDDVFSDTSVTQEETLASLSNLRSIIEIKMRNIVNDMKKLRR